VPKLSINFEEILDVRGSVHLSSSSSSSSSNVYCNCNCVINAKYNYYISNNGLLEECYK